MNFFNLNYIIKIIFLRFLSSAIFHVELKVRILDHKLIDVLPPTLIELQAMDRDPLLKRD